MKRCLRGKKAEEGESSLKWIVTNYEWVRAERRLKILKEWLSRNKKGMLVLDESSAVKTHNSITTKSCRSLREKAAWTILINGTPVDDNPMDLYSQFNVLHKDILECKHISHYRNRYAVMGGYMQRQVVRWKNLDSLQARLKPFVLRREKKDCLDLPEKLPVKDIPVELNDSTWSHYTDMKRYLITWLEDQPSSAIHGGTKIIRLAQITSGLLSMDDELEPNRISTEKIDTLMEWLALQYNHEKDAKVVIWCRFREEVNTIKTAIEETQIIKDLPTYSIIGGQKESQREQAIEAFHPESPKGRAVLVGSVNAGKTGINLAGAHIVMYVSHDYKLSTRLQSEDRVHRPGQTQKVSYYNLVGVGPDHQQTIDGFILKQLKNKHDVANLAVSKWIEYIDQV